MDRWIDAYGDMVDYEMVFRKVQRTVVVAVGFELLFDDSQIDREGARLNQLVLGSLMANLTRTERARVVMTEYKLVESCTLNYVKLVLVARLALQRPIGPGRDLTKVLPRRGSWAK